MLPETGKIKVPAVDDQHIYLGNHRAKGLVLRGQFMIYKRADKACWLDELEPQEGCGAPEFSPSSSVQCFRRTGIVAGRRTGTCAACPKTLQLRPQG